MGYHIIIHTTRVNEHINSDYSEEELVDILTKGLDKAEMPWDEIGVAKPVADFYVDDRSIKFESWPEILKTVKETEATQK
jgi:hypothetical protein